MSESFRQVTDLHLNIPNFLKLLYDHTVRESYKLPKGRRSVEKIKKFSTLAFIVGGRFLYEILSANLALPSPSSVNGYMQVDDCDARVFEGHLRAKELKAFLLRRHLPPYVWLSEDGTRIVDKIQYDGTTDQLIGMVLPLSQSTGMPIPNTSETSLEYIQQTMKSSEKSKILYTAMAKPMAIGSPSFCLTAFGTNNRFTSTDVLRRIKFTKAKLNEEGITTAGFSSDGDPKLLQAMRIQLQLPTITDDKLPKRFLGWFVAKFRPDILCVQDAYHIGTKLKNRLLNTVVMLILGNSIVTASHLKIFLDNVSKDQHHLTIGDINGADKMNVDSVKRIFSQKVGECLKKHVPGSNATILYLKLIRFIFLAFSYKDQEKDITPLERIYYIWHVVFIMRIWRYWLFKHKEYNLHNFVTSNSYMCVEINAHSLINAAIAMKEENRDQLFLTCFMQSQECENFYRLLRSSTSTYSTMVNFSLLDVLYRIKRVNLQNEIIGDLKDDFVFPRHQGNVAGVGANISLPTIDEIADKVLEVKQYFIIFDCKTYFL